jgi:hypothetical protein
MSDTTERTLADLGPGDEVIEFEGGWMPRYARRKIDRVTDTQIIVGGRRFKRKPRYSTNEGFQIGGQSRIGFGQQAEREVVVIIAKQKRSDIVARLHSTTRTATLEQDCIVKLEALCAEARAFLIEAGEWKDEP